MGILERMYIFLAKFKNNPYPYNYWENYESENVVVNGRLWSQKGLRSTVVKSYDSWQMQNATIVV